MNLLVQEEKERGVLPTHRQLSSRTARTTPARKNIRAPEDEGYLKQD